MGDFDYDYRGVGLYMKTDLELAAALRARAELALAFAKSISPVGDPTEGDEHPGRYRDSLTVTGPHPIRDRITYRIETDVPYAAAVEKRHDVLGKTVAAFGDPKGGPGL